MIIKVLPIDLIIREAFDVRSDSDYDDFFVLSKEEVKEQIENAEKFYHAVETYLKTQIAEEES